jgi:hypothetical protein
VSLAQGITDGFFKPKGEASVVASYGAENYNNYFAGNDKIELGRAGYYIALFADYGVTDKITASVSLPYISSGEGTENLQDFRALLKGIIKEFNTETGSVSIGLVGGFSTPISNYTSGGLFAIGQRATILETRLVAQSKWNTGWFYSLQSGYSYKFGDTPNSIPFTFKAGKAASKYYYDVFYDFQNSSGGIDYLGSPSPQNFEALGVSFHKIGGSFYYAVYKDFGATVNASYILGGRNTFQGPSYGIGLIYNFRK